MSGDKSNVWVTRLIATLNGTDKGGVVAGLLNEIKTEPTHNGGMKRRRIEQIADQLDDEDRVAFTTALDDYTIPAIAIVRVMQRRGFSISESVISNYRRGIYVDR